MKKIIVTGGAGFIGSHIVDALIKTGTQVTVVDNLSTGNKDNLNHILDKIEFCEVDINDTEEIKKIFEGADAVVHQAAIPSVPRSMSDPIASHKANSLGTLSVLLAAKEMGVDRVVLASSSSVYGDTPTLPKVETMIPNPLSPYAVQKFTDELYAKIFYNLFGLKTIALRYFNVFGPRQNPNSEYAAVIPKFITLMKGKKSPLVNGDGNHTRDFTYIDNVVLANILSLNTQQGFGEVYNIAGSRQISLNTLIEKINQNLGTEIKPIYQEPRPGDIKDSYANIDKAKEILQFNTRVSFEEGLALTIESLE